MKKRRLNKGKSKKLMMEERIMLWLYTCCVS